MEGIIIGVKEEGTVVKSGRLALLLALRVRELDLDVELERMFSEGSDGLCLIFPVL